MIKIKIQRTFLKKQINILMKLFTQKEANFKITFTIKKLIKRLRLEEYENKSLEMSLNFNI